MYNNKVAILVYSNTLSKTQLLLIGFSNPEWFQVLWYKISENYKAIDFLQ